jgi:hypothetical protein
MNVRKIAIAIVLGCSSLKAMEKNGNSSQLEGTGYKLSVPSSPIKNHYAPPYAYDMRAKIQANKGAYTGFGNGQVNENEDNDNSQPRYSFYANVYDDNGSVGNGSVDTGSINLNIASQALDERKMEKKEKKKDWFYRACVTCIMLNTLPDTMQDQMYMLDLRNREIDNLGLYLTQNKKLWGVRGRTVNLKKSDLIDFAPITVLLAKNLLKELPTDFSQLAGTLVELSLAGNEFKKVPPVVQQLTQLKKLDVSDNPIAKIENGDLKGLELTELWYSAPTKCSKLLHFAREKNKE